MHGTWLESDKSLKSLLYNWSSSLDHGFLNRKEFGAELS